MQTCNLCGGTRWETLEAENATRVVRCACGLVFVTPQPPRSALEQAYDGAYYRPWEGQARRRGQIWRRRVDRVHLLAGRPGRLLDVGCGTGAFLRLARERGWDVAGTELSRGGAKAAAASGLLVFTGEVWEADFPPATFDLITCWHVIEHVGDPRRVVGEFYRILRPGGWVVLATPNLEDRIFRTAYRLGRGRRPRLYEAGEREIHLFVFSPATLERLFTSAGFGDVRVGFDRGAAAVWAKHLVNQMAYGWFRITGRNWGMALELTARKPPPPQCHTTTPPGSAWGHPHHRWPRASPDAGPDNPRPRVMVVMPAYNAARTLRATIQDLPAVGIAEVILVDDASQDGTPELAEALGLTVLRHPRNLGYGGNQKTCYRAALARDADIVVMVHPDHQYNPRIVPELAAPIARGDCDAALGSRMLGGRYFEGGMPWWKYCANIALTATFNLATGRFLTECHSGFRAYSRRYLTGVNFAANSNRFVFDVQILLQGIDAGMRFCEIPIDTRYFAEASQVGVGAGTRYGLSILVALAAYRLHRMGLWTPAFLRRPLDGGDVGA